MKNEISKYQKKNDDLEKLSNELNEKLNFNCKNNQILESVNEKIKDQNQK